MMKAKELLHCLLCLTVMEKETLELLVMVETLFLNLFLLQLMTAVMMMTDHPTDQMEASAQQDSMTSMR